MKQLIWCTGIFLVLAGPAAAQTGSAQKGTKNTKTVKNISPKKSVKKGTSATAKADLNSGAVKRTSTGAYAARAAAPGVSGQSQIADPLVRALDARANGAPVRISGSGIVGMPRYSYGLANGRITFLPQGSRTTGSINGSGAVGTGTSPGVVSSAGPAMRLNGKNPYSDPGV